MTDAAVIKNFYSVVPLALLTLPSVVSTPET